MRFEKPKQNITTNADKGLGSGEIQVRATRYRITWKQRKIVAQVSPSSLALIVFREQP